MRSFEPIIISGAEVLPLVEGGKGVSITKGECTGTWSAEVLGPVSS